ncbi:bifunctional diaminohydroxyphosphoribosylaminopyrimidine deaminase/5-amino-6-(5-phosphoribosylamino)uracil reductase RibD [Gayadomonas joobiniege]|uniref:bifunctional diaminohydroxyphosphoribosylaminopyrimidine deaminase/5-amino-6-(5-phosphoribosylamino)uracil reductase RibD n=1 Tax=Gayadomonas joobiniege TaxID=1234606 RepID=UPI0003802457|nr:bifunctional diaminohydroxyphosphoribosylaminopyrimidine deaminase/5-amino-6-(5-phosphoribosylamino)uracil reductase RibD [Gayadomonas joobiniege]
MSVLTQQDFQYMAQAIKLAEQGRFTTHPNPNVGCVIVKDGQVIGRGYHKIAGGPHAERHALEQAGSMARGSCVYVTLEPCSHTGRTGPCADALIRAGVARVVVGMQDPNPKVSGRGIQKLRDAGIYVITECLEAACEQLNPGFLKRMRTGLPYVRLKLACSLDGATAMASGQSQWITGAAARRDVQGYRAKSSAILTGSGTVLADDPILNVRAAELNFEYPGEIRQPERLVIDSKHKLTPDYKMFNDGQSVTLVGTEHRSGNWPDTVKFLTVTKNDKNDQVQLSELFKQLGVQEYNDIWVEAGSQLAGALIDENLVDELIIYQAPILLGQQTRRLVEFNALSQLENASRWQYVSQTRVGNDLKLILKAI